MINSYAFGGFHIAKFHEHATYDGVAFVCTIYEEGKPVGTAEQAGQGGCTTMSFNDRAADAHFDAAAQTFYEQQRDPNAGAMREELLYYLIEAYELDRDVEMMTICRTSLTDELGLYRRRGFMPPLRPAQLAQVAQHYPDCTHVWTIGVGWAPLP